MPEARPLTDFHIHTSHSYCAPENDVHKVVAAARARDAERIALVCHSGQLYVDSSFYWSQDVIRNPEMVRKARRTGTDRVRRFLDDCAPYRSESVLVGLELDCDISGNMVVLEEDLAHFDLLIGAVHYVPPRELWESRPERAQAQFLGLHRTFLSQGFHILAHPFRPLTSSGVPPSPNLARELARMAFDTGVALEINFHNHVPYRPLFERCVELGVPISFGSDAHKLSEVADLAPHLEFLNLLGASDESLFAGPPVRRAAGL